MTYPISKDIFHITHYPRVNVYITMERSTMLLSKSTVSMAIFNGFLYVYQRVNLHFLWFPYGFPIKTSIFPWFSYGFPIKTSIFPYHPEISPTVAPSPTSAVEFTAAPPRSRSFRRRFSPNSPSSGATMLGGPDGPRGPLRPAVDPGGFNGKTIGKPWENHMVNNQRVC